MTVAIERLRELFTLDEQTGVLYRKVRSANVKAGSVAGSLGRNGYLYTSVDGRLMLVHRIVYAMVNGSWPIADVDHINGERADNRPTNLRAASRSQNMMNGSLRSDNKSGIKGVFWDSRKGKWRAEIRAAGQSRFLGYFVSKEAAAQAAGDFRERAHKEFARHV